MTTTPMPVLMPTNKPIGIGVKKDHLKMLIFEEKGSHN